MSCVDVPAGWLVIPYLLVVAQSICVLMLGVWIGIIKERRRS